MEVVREYKSSVPLIVDARRGYTGLSMSDNRAVAENQASLRGVIQRSTRNLFVSQPIQSSNTFILQLERGKKGSSSKKSVAPSAKSKPQSQSQSTRVRNIPVLEKGGHGAYAWSLDGAPGVGYAFHHVINFNSCLKPWFDIMVGKYMLYKDDNGNQTYVDGLKKIMNAVGINIKSNGDINGGSQTSYVWRSANLFVGVKPEQRTDDPGDKNEFSRTSPVTSERLKAHLSYGEKVYDKTKEVESNIDNTVWVEGNCQAFESLVGETRGAYISDCRGEVENTDWKVKAGSVWGGSGRDYGLK